MGMCTELVLKADVKSDIPQGVRDIFNFLFGDGDEPSSLPNHPFFNTERWSSIGRSCSYYHVPWTSSKFSEDYIFSRSDLKNYGGEIGLFIAWVKPYLNEIDGNCIGWSWYEEDETPTLICM